MASLSVSRSVCLSLFVSHFVFVLHLPGDRFLAKIIRERASVLRSGKPEEVREA